MTSPKRALAAFALGALALPVLSVAPAALADGAATPPVPLGVGAFCAGVADAGFSDVASDHTFRSEINCIAAAEITRGLQGGNQYGPSLPVSRAQMASFIARMLDTADRLDQFGHVRALPEASGTNRFTDIAGDDTHRAAIDRLAAVGIVQGGPAGLPAAQYGPTLNVSRAQMASFVIRSLEFALDTDLSTDEDYFTDDADAAPHVANINTIASLAIAVGDGRSSYTPAGPTSRGQMAAFIARSLSYLESRQLIRPLLAPPTNQSFTVTPSVAETLTLGGDAASRTRTYSVRTSAAGVVHQIQLIPNQNVTLGTDGAVTFADADDDDAADVDSTVARVTSVNNVVVSGTTSTRATAVPVAGTITFTVQGEGLESVVPLVFFDADGDGALNLDAGNAPVAAELFGVGGATTFVNPAAGNQLLSEVDVQRINRAANQFDANDHTFTYDSNDTFTINGSPATLDEFKAALTRGDRISATYRATTAQASSFALTNISPTTPSAPRVSVGTGADVDVVTVVATIVGPADTVQVQRALLDSTAVAGVFVTIAVGPATDDSPDPGVQVTFIDRAVPPGSYQYRVVLTTDGEVGPASLPSATVTTTVPPPDTTLPLALDTRIVTDVGLGNILDEGDVFTIRAEEALAAPAAGSFIRVQDRTSTTNTTPSVADLICGTNATCVLNTVAIPSTATVNGGAAAGTVLTVTITAAPTVVAPGGVAGISLPARIVNTAGITDLTGNRLDLVASADLVIGTIGNPGELDD